MNIPGRWGLYGTRARICDLDDWKGLRLAVGNAAASIDQEVSLVGSKIA
jgi:hypothetical protein